MSRLKKRSRQPLETVCCLFWKKVIRLPLRIVLIPMIKVTIATAAASRNPVFTPDEKSIFSQSALNGKMPCCSSTLISDPQLRNSNEASPFQR